MISGGDSKRHRICHLCLKQHLAAGRTREQPVSLISGLPVQGPSTVRRNMSLFRGTLRHCWTRGMDSMMRFFS